MRVVPHVVDHDQALPAVELLRELVCRVFEVDKGRAFACQRIVEFEKLAHQIRLLAEGDPEDAAVERGPHPLVVADGSGEGGLAVASGAAQRCGEGHGRSAFGVEQVGDEFLELFGARDIVLRWGFGHTGDVRRAIVCLGVARNGFEGALGRQAPDERRITRGKVGQLEQRLEQSAQRMRARPIRQWSIVLQPADHVPGDGSGWARQGDSRDEPLQSRLAQQCAPSTGSLVRELGPIGEDLGQPLAFVRRQVGFGHWAPPPVNWLWATLLQAQGVCRLFVRPGGSESPDT